MKIKKEKLTRLKTEIICSKLLKCWYEKIRHILQFPNSKRVFFFFALLLVLKYEMLRCYDESTLQTK